MFTPTTALRLLDTPLESDYRNTLWFPNREAQTAYFLGKTIKTYENFQYIKKNNTIVVDGEVDLLYNCNYIMYQNNNFTNKWFYAFIDRIEWASNSSVRLYVSTDVIQTWFFDITYYDSYVDRCHSDTDVAGDNIVPEDFSGTGNGGYYQVGSQDLKPDWVTVFATTDYTGNPLPPTDLNGLISGAGAVRKKYDNASLTNLLNGYVKNGTATAVTKIQQWPANHDATISYAKHPTHIDANGVSYTPVNKKLLSGAFLTAYAQMMGQEIEFNPEYITGANINGKIVVDDTSGLVGFIITNYSNTNIASISMAVSIPESQWGYNQYKNDYNLHNASNSIYVQRSRQNRNLNYYNKVIDTATGALDTVANAASMLDAKGLITNPVRTIVGGASSTLSSFAGAVTSGFEASQYASGIDEITQDLTAISESYNAPATGGVAQSNIYIAGKKTALSYGFKTPPLDIVKRCDKFLTVYGYKQSEYRAINLHARASWTYIKTNGLNASGNFPDDDMNIIKRAFNNGIFFWVYTATYGNFGQNNAIV